MYQPELRLLKALLGFVNTGEMEIPKGTIFTNDGEPVVSMPQVYPSGSDWMKTRAYGVTLLERAASKDYDWLAHEINSKKTVTAIWSFDPTDKVFSLIPTVNDGKDFPIIVVLLALCTKIGKGESLAHRIRKCKNCQSYFFQKTRRESGFDSARCRTAYANRTRTLPRGSRERL